MVNSPRPGSGRSGSNQGNRRPRVAGLRKRASQDSRTELPDSSLDEAVSGAGSQEGSSGEAATVGITPPETTPTDAGSTDTAATGTTPTGTAATETTPANTSVANAETGLAADTSESVLSGAKPGSPAETRTPGKGETESAETEPVAGSESTVVVRNGVVGVESDTGKSQGGDTAVPEPDAHSSTSDRTGGRAKPATPDRDADRAKPAGSEGVRESGTASPGTAKLDPPEPGAAGTRTRLLAVLIALAVFCLGLTVWFRTEVRALTSDGPAANQALVDNATTSEVNGQVSDAVAKVFSYDFADTAKNEGAADELLTGGAVDEYNQLFSQVKQMAPQQKLIVTTTVKSSAVSRLQGDRAELLVFVDQTATRADNGEPSTYPAQISVGAEKQGDQWKISKITQR